MKSKPLSDLKIKNAKKKEDNYQLGDTGGLYLLVKKNGSKLWQMRYTSPTSKKRNILSIGKYPEVSLSQARLARDKYKKQIASGIDPIEEKRLNEQKDIKDIAGLCSNLIDEWLEKEAKNTKPTTQKSKARLFNVDIKPFLKNKHIKDVTIEDVLSIIENKQDTAPEMASRIYTHLENIFRYAVLKKHCERNILADIRKKDVIKPRVAKHMAKITNLEILKELIQKIYSYYGNHNTRNVLKLVLHVPLRAENLCHLKWEHIDFNKKILTIPRENMKLNNINLDDFSLPLTDEVISILKDQLSMQQYYTNEDGYVFLGRDNNKPINKESPNKALNRMGFNDEKKGNKIRLHGFRGTFRSLIDTLDVNNRFSFEVKERVLDHHSKSIVVRAYNHKSTYQMQMIELMNFWSNFICELRV